MEVYIWLSYKYEKEFIERELGNVLRDRVSKIIESIIENTYFNVYNDVRKESSIESEGEESEEDISKRNKSRKADQTSGEKINNMIDTTSVLLTDVEKEGKF